MKYYYPTSTLNFDAIASSQCLAPTSFYCEKAIGFSRYERTVVDSSDDYLIFYPHPVLWSIPQRDSLDYPMLVEIDDESGLLNHGEWVALQTGSHGIRRSQPYYFRPVDILMKRIRFLFRTQEELRQIVNRAQSNVAEYKLSGVSEAWNLDNYGLIGSTPEVMTIKAAPFVGDVTDSPVNSWDSAWAEYVKQDRLDGAATGFRAGCWLLAQRSGRFIDTMRGAVTFEVWREMLSPEFNALLDMICNNISLRWDVNRKAVVDFCATCWNDCFAEAHNETRHQILRSIAKSVADTTYVYPIQKIEDSEMQALACLVLSGKRDATLINLIKTQDVRMPELALALHGALVGYSVLSRTLFEKRSYVQGEFGDEEVSRADLPSTHQIRKPVVGKTPPRVKESQDTADVTRIEHERSTCVSAGLTGWKERMMETIISLKSWANVKPQQQDKKKRDIYKMLVESKNEGDFLDRLADKSGYKKLAKEIKCHHLSEREGSLFENSISSDDNRMKSILADNSWMAAVVEECVFNSKARAALEEDLKWYIEEREIKGSGNLEYAQQYVDQSNSAVINRIREFLENQKYHPTERQQQYRPDKIKAYQDVDIERVVHWLRDRFEV